MINNSPTPILTLRLLDIPLPEEPGTKKLLLNGAKDLAREHEHLFKEKGLDINVFHNKEVLYSGIQLGRYQRAPEWTAIGDQAVQALGLWYDLFKKQATLPILNTVEIREHYTPEFLVYQKRYRSRSLLISDQLAQELNTMNDKFMRFDRLEKYLFGNIQTFLEYIGYEYDRHAHFLKVTMHEFHYHEEARPVYHQQKKTACALRFSCNFRLPQTLRLGQATALGYGRVTHG